MTAYYNEIDKFAAAWLRELIKAGHIAPGDVDERSIEDVKPDDLRPYTQCHFFAGVGIWSYALRLAGWDDSRPVWTGSCPCQPFSAAGKAAGFDDERHLWPSWFHLIEHAKPRGVPVFGEQVASKDGLAWLDLVYADLEGAQHSVRALDFCAAGVGAPHIRQRLYFVADTQGWGRQWDWSRKPGVQEDAWIGRNRPSINSPTDELADTEGYGRQHGPSLTGSDGTGVEPRKPRRESGADSIHGVLADAESRGLRELRISSRQAGQPHIGDRAGIVGDSIGTRLERLGGYGDEGYEPGRIGARKTGHAAEAGAVSGMADADDAKRRSDHAGRNYADRQAPERQQGNGDAPEYRATRNEWTGPTNGHWRDVDWLLCRDGKWRPVESGTFPLVNGAAARMGRLRGFGNGIVAEAAKAFIQAYEGVMP